MIRLHTSTQGTLAVFALSPEDRRNFGFPEPHQVCLDTDRRDSPIEDVAQRWLIVASMLTGLTENEVETEGFAVLRYPFGKEDIIPVPTGTVFLRVTQ